MNRKTAFLLFAAALLLAGPVAAQSGLSSSKEAAAKPAGGKSREEETRAHEEKLRKLIQERRQQREETRRKMDELKKVASDNAASRGMAGVPLGKDGKPGLGPGAVAGGGKASSPKAGGGGKVVVIEAGTLLYLTFFNPLTKANELDTETTAGENFAGSVEMINDPPSPVDRLRIVLDYDKRFVEPLRVLDGPIRDRIKGAPVFRQDDREGRLVYEAELKEPILAKHAPLLEIVWHALRPTNSTQIDFAFPEGDGPAQLETGAYVRDHNVLGDAGDPVDGVLGASILIGAPPRKDGKEAAMQGKASELRREFLGAVGETGRVGLKLVPPAETIRVGDEFIVHAALVNPRGAVVDKVAFRLEFDPTAVRVLDNDRGNTIRRGVNIHDAPYRRSFPWIFHETNRVDNTRGVIEYAMGFGESRSLESAVFADIHFVALKPVGDSPLNFIRHRSGAPDPTRVSTFGYDLLDWGKDLTTASASLAIHTSDFTEPTPRPKTNSELAQEFLRNTGALAPLPPPKRETGY